MKKLTKLLIYLFLIVIFPVLNAQTGSIRINQLGYYPSANKYAIVTFTKATTFEVINIDDNSVAFSGTMSPEVFWTQAGDSVKKCDFSELTAIGKYKIHIPDFADSYPFEISNTVLKKAAYASLKSYYYQRSSYELTAPYAGLWARAAGHPDTACVLHSSTGKSGKISSPGGWYDAGDYGKYVINAGISVATMLSFYENFNNYFEDGSIKIPESGNGKNDLLDEVKFELDWLKTMQDNDDGGVYFKLTTLSFCGMIMPSADIAARYAIGKTTSSALDFAAMMAMAGRIYANYDADYAADCIDRAEKAWIWAKDHPAIYFKNPSDVSTGEYGDGNVSDEFIWAAAELYITTAKDEYKTYLEGKSGSLLYQGAAGWPQVQPLACLSLATIPNGLSANLITTIKNSILTTANNWLSQINTSPCRIPTFGFNWGSNSQIANYGVGMLYAYFISNDQKYIKGAAECADYLLGKNATGYSFISSYGSKTPMNFHHRPSTADGILQPVPGFVSGGPNPGREDNERYPFLEPAKSFVDVSGSYASNEVCINWNSPVTALFAGVDAVLGDNSAVEFEVPTSVNNPPAISLTSPTFSAKLGSDAPVTVKGTVTDPDGISKIEYYLDSHFAGLIENPSFQFNLNGLNFGSHVITILAYDSKGLVSEKSTSFSYYIVSNLPGKVEAEYYSNMSGVSNQNTTDTDGGLNVTSLTTNDWVDYTLLISSSAQYRVEYRIASATTGGKLELKKSTGLVLSTMNVPSTGGSQKWVTIADTISLTGSVAKQILRLSVVSGGWNLNWINFVKLNPVSVEEIASDVPKNDLSIFPNPVSTDFTVKYSLEKATSVEFRIYSSDGKLISKKKQNNLQFPSGEFNWNLNNKIAAGTYYLNMFQDGNKLAGCTIVMNR